MRYVYLTTNPELAKRAFYIQVVLLYNAHEINAGIPFTDLLKAHNVLIPHFDFFYQLSPTVEWKQKILRHLPVFYQRMHLHVYANDY